MEPVEGSIQWAMNHGHLFQVNGGNFRYGQLMAMPLTHQEAADESLYKGETYSVWVPPGTILTVWRVVGGTIGGFHLNDPQRFVVRAGCAHPMEGEIEL